MARHASFALFLYWVAAGGSLPWIVCSGWEFVSFSSSWVDSSYFLSGKGLT